MNRGLSRDADFNTGFYRENLKVISYNALHFSYARYYRKRYIIICTVIMFNSIWLKFSLNNWNDMNVLNIIHSWHCGITNRVNDTLFENSKKLKKKDRKERYCWIWLNMRCSLAKKKTIRPDMQKEMRSIFGLIDINHQKR